MDAIANNDASGTMKTSDRQIIRSHAVNHIDEAVANGWIRVYYQPVIRTVSRKVCGFEALARWEDPELGLLCPFDFIGALEEARLIHKLDMCVIDQVCKQLRHDIDAGLPVVPISFNLSRLDFDLCDIRQAIEDTVHSYRISRNLINIEITESVFGTEPAFMAAAIDKFRSTGYQVWMDDFGSAYSSLNVLKDFDFDELKIDMEFLNRFGKKSRAIVASVVDMAKHLGIQTLAEGVETLEHSEFLRHIGCEKQQGYLYGKPQPFGPNSLAEFDENPGIERESERRYYRTIGSVNTLTLSERNFMPDNKTEDYMTSMPLAFVEYDKECDAFCVLSCNEPFTDALEGMNIRNVNTAERLINDTRRLPARNARRLIEHIAHDTYARHDYVSGGLRCIMRAKYLASNGPRISVLVTIESAEKVIETGRQARMREALGALCSIYEHIDVVHLDEGYSEPVYSQAAFTMLYEVPNLHEAVRQFADNEVFPDDRSRYLAFIDPDTLGERVDANEQNYIVGFFRLRDHGGDYSWKLITVIRLVEPGENEVLVCIRDTHWDNDTILQTIFASDNDDDELSNPSLQSGQKADDLKIGDGSLWRSIVDNPHVGIFWKDTERRFIGCNQAFLDYYGFDSAESVIGKTDEDMRWHVDPIPFKLDEEHVIHDGMSSDNVPGQCIANGELRDIVASKRPVYHNGRIVGLVGYFLDIGNALTQSATADIIAHSDSVTGMLNYSGLDIATGHFIDSYQKLGVDFAALDIDIHNFRAFNEKFGYEFGDKILRTIGDIIRKELGDHCVVGHIYADRFIILRQDTSKEEMEKIGKQIVDKLAAVSSIDGTRCTIYAHCSVSLFSEAEDFEEFKHLNRMRLHEAKAKK